MDIFIIKNDLSAEIFSLKDYVITNVQLPTAALAIQYLFVLRPMRNHKQISCDNIVQSCDPAQCPKT